MKRFGLRLPFPKSEAKVLAAMLLCSLGVRTALFPVQGCLTDLATFAAWFQAAAENSPHVFYDVVGWCDYPPLNVYVFWVFGSLAKWLSVNGTPFLTFFIKLPSTLFDVATSFLVFVFVRKRLDFNHSMMSAFAYAFNPATIFNVSIWGQYDAIYTFFLVLSVMFTLDSRFKLSITAFTLGVLAKPQSIALAPLIAFLLIRKRSWRVLITSAIILSAVTAVVVVPLRLNDPLGLLFNVYLKGYRGYPYTSLNAFNFWSFMGFWKSDAGTLFFLDFFKIGWIMFGAAVTFSLYYVYKSFRRSPEMSVVFTAFFLLFAFFMLPTRIHERYLFPVFAFLALMLPNVRDSRPIYGVLTFTYFTNLAYVLPFLNRGAYISDGDIFVWMIALINIAVFVYSVIFMAKNLKPRKTAGLTI